MVDTRYKTKAGSVFFLNYHLAWCPKNKRKAPAGNVAVRLKELLSNKTSQLDVDIEALEIMPDQSYPKGYTSQVLRQQFA